MARKPALPSPARLPVPTRPIREILVRLSLDYAYGRDVLRGVSRYRPKFGPWRIRHGTLGEHEDRTSLVSPTACGVICMFASDRLAALGRELPYPAVNVSGSMADTGLPSVLPDNVAVGRLGAEHLLERGFARLAFFGGHKAFERDRWTGFSEAVKQAGRVCELLNAEGAPEEQSLRALTTPVGLMADSDRRAARLVGAAAAIGLRVPDDVAIIGVDNDELECSVADPRLSSVDPGAERVGYEAAALLDRLLAGERPSALPMLVPPSGVVARDSTDVVAVEEPALAAAIHFIRTHACNSIRVGDIVQVTGISRRTLEIRFRSQFGRTLHDEIRRVRMQRAAQMLVETDMKIADVAQCTGYTDFRRFIREFSRVHGPSPGKYRRQFRLI